MPNINYKCWIGKYNCLSNEISKLKQLLKLVLDERANLILSPEEKDDFDWICSENYSQLEDQLCKTSGGHIALQTSGTTGIPKVIWKSYKLILKDKKGLGSENDRWLLTYNPGRWAGLSVILHTHKNNSQLITPKSLGPENILDSIGEATHISITPSLFRKLIILDYEKLRDAPIQQLTFGGEYATQKVLNDAKSVWPNARISHIYATTELGDICVCNDGLEGIPVSKISRPCELLDTGELIIDNIPTGDMWKIENNRLYFTGRLVESINVGGAKVSQSVIESVVNGVNGIRECRAYPMFNALLGEVVAIDYVGDITPIELKKILLKLLPKYAVPVKINKVDYIELTSAGKLKRIE